MTVDDTAYEKVGDLEAPFCLTAKDERRQRDREHLRESMRCDVAPLSFEEYSAGAPCPGCGQPYRDVEPFEFRGTMNLSGRAKERYEAEQLRFKAQHSLCRSHRHSVQVLTVAVGAVDGVAVDADGVDVAKALSA